MKGILVTSFVMCLLLLPTFVHASTSAQDIISQQTGISQNTLNNIPQTPQQAQDMFLKQAWGEIIANNKYLGPVDRFFSSVSMVFVILFGEGYSLSPTLLGVIILWAYVAMESTIILNGIGALNPWINRGLSIALSIVLAQIGAFRGIVSLLGSLIYSQETWVLRIVAALGFFVALFILHYISKIVGIKLNKAKENAKEKNIEGEIKNEKEFIKGIKEGSKI